MTTLTPPRQGVQYVNETLEERKERLQLEKLKTAVREALEEFIEDHKKDEKGFFDQLLGG
jgi:hypothetical protein